MSNLLYLFKVQRMHPVAAHVTRTLDQDMNIGGYRVPRGVSVTVDILSLHNDEEVFPEPEEFRPESFHEDSLGSIGSFAYTPFSGGPRNCIGFRFALTEMKIIIAHLIKDFTLQLVDENEKLEITHRILTQPKELVRIRFLPRR